MKYDKIKELLKQYLVCRRYLDSQEYAKEYFNPNDTQKIDEKEQYEARLHAIESLIQFLAPSNEYTLLRLHYCKGISIEKCAESMDISYRTAYRILENAYKKLSVLINKGGAE
jgi:predicted DNA-binding protein (UPF0251 family)